MKKLAFTILMVASMVAPAGAQFFRGGPCGGACLYSNSKECLDAKRSFAEKHGGIGPERYCNQYYQGQRGRWVQSGNQWQWNGVQGDQWYQGRRGHWYNHDGWQFHSDKGEQYARGHDGGWGWKGGPPQQPRVETREGHGPSPKRK